MTPRLKPSPAVYWFFLISGITSLMYEVIWMRSLALVFGNTTHATALVLAAFMLGLGLGGYGIGRWVEGWRNEFFGYGLLEIGIAVYAALTYFWVALVQEVYTGLALSGPVSSGGVNVARLGLSFLVVLIPAFCMGGTLPVLVRYLVRSGLEIGRETSRLYALNIVGAVAGTMAAGFWLIPRYGMKTTLGVAVGLNLIIGLWACRLGRRIPPGPAVEGSAPSSPGSTSRARRPWMAAGVFIIGLAAMILEVSWTRVLASVLGSSTYAFSLMLSTFLLGMAAGSGVWSRVLKRRPARMPAWTWLQWGLATLILLTLPAFEWLGLAMVRVFGLVGGNPFWLDGFRFVLCVGIMAGPTFCLGASFPLSVALYDEQGTRAGRQVGVVYLWNTLGNMTGALGAGFLLIPWIGIHHTILIAGGLALLLGWGVALLHLRRHPAGFVLLSLAVLLPGILLFRQRDGWDPRLVSIGMQLRPERFLGKSTASLLGDLFDSDILFYQEGQNSIVSVFQDGDHRSLKVNGKTDASTGHDVATQLLSGHIPHLLHPDPKRTLVIGLGSGMTLAAALAHPIEQVDVVELEPAVIQAAPWFDVINRKAYQDPRARILVNDGRNHLLMGSGTYDVIISEPSNPWMAGVAGLFTAECYRLVAQRLAPNGIFCQWIQIYGLSPTDLKMVVRTVRSVFPHVTLWMSLPGDLLILASRQPAPFELGRAQKRFSEQPLLREDFHTLDMNEAVGVLAYFLLDESEVEAFVEGVELHLDDRMQLEFRAPRTRHHASLVELNRALLRKYCQHELPPVHTSGPPLAASKEVLAAIGWACLGKRFANRVEEARSYFARAIQLDGEYPPALAGLGRCLLLDNKQTYALSMLMLAAQKQPAVLETKIDAALAAWRGGDANYAAEVFGELAAAHPDDERLWQWRGQALEERTQYKEAASAFRHSFEMHPQPLIAGLGCARCLRMAGEMTAAAQVIEALRGRYRTNMDVHEELLRIYDALGQAQPAIKALEELTGRNPWRPQYWAALARLYRAEKASEAYQRAVQQGRKTSPYFDDFLSASSALEWAETRQTTDRTTDQTHAP